MGRDFASRLDAAFAAVGGWSFDHRWVVAALALSLLGGSLVLASRVQVDNSYESYFDPADPVYRAYERYREDFGSDEVSYIVYEAPDREHGPFDLEVMRQIVQLTAALEAEVPFLYEVDSLASAELMVGVPGGIEIRELRDDLPESQEALLRLRERYLAKPLFRGGILSPDGRSAALILQMDRSSTDPIEAIRLDPEGGNGLENLYPQPTETAISEILSRPEYAGIRFYHTGDVPMNAAYNRIIGEESAALQALTSAVVALLLAFFFRSAVGVIAPIAVVQLSVLMVVAFVVCLGWKLDLSFSSAPTLLTAIGVAHSVHILSEFRTRFARLGDRREALVSTLSLVGTPCLLTTLTTAVGFLAMFLVPIRSISHMAVFNAFGVLAAFGLSFTLLTAFLSFGSRAPGRRDAAGPGDRMHAVLGWIARFAARFRVAILVAFGVVFALSAAGISRLVVDSNWIDDFSEEMPLKQVTRKVDELMGGVSNLVLLFDAGAPESVQDPAFLRDVERIQRWADTRGDLVRKTTSIVDILKDLNQTFHADDPDHFVLPGSRDLVSQYLLLYDSAGGAERDETVSSDYRRASLSLRLGVAPTSATAAIVDDLRAELEARPLQASSLEITGIGALWVVLLDYIVTSQVRGFLIAFSVIGALMCLLFGSLKTGLIAMVPNLSPVVLTLGVMGWAGIPLDYNKVSIAAVAMGIAVDDTIHLVLRFRHEFRRVGRYREALVLAMQDVGRALWITSVALVLGFGVLLASSLDSQATYGILLAATIVAALVADFLLMPALVLVLRPFGPEAVGEPAAGAARRAAPADPLALPGMR